MRPASIRKPSLTSIMAAATLFPASHLPSAISVRIQMMARRNERPNTPVAQNRDRPCAGTAKCVLLPDFSDDGQASDRFPSAAGKVTPDQVRFASVGKPKHASRSGSANPCRGGCRGPRN